MALFPGTIYSNTNPTSLNYRDDVGVVHHTLHSAAIQEITAIETKVGVDNSAVTTTLDYLLKNTASVDPGHKHTFSGSINVGTVGTGLVKSSGGVFSTVTAPTGVVVGTSDTQTLTNKTLDATDVVPAAAIKAEAWTTWTPTYSASGSMTYTGVTTNYAKFIQLGKTILYAISSNGTTGGTASTALQFTLPVTAANTAGFGGGGVLNDGGGGIGLATFLNSTTQAAVTRYDGANMSLAGNHQIKVSGVYEAA